MRGFPLKLSDLPASLRQITLPRVALVRQHFPSDRIDSVETALRRELDARGVRRLVQPGQTVAITAGSRGIDRIVELLKTLVSYLRAGGAEPFLVPAMGSHAGATAEGQVQLLKKYGITPQSVGAEIRSSMDVVELGRTPEGIRVLVDRIAWQADRIVVVNRVKPHTAFHGPIESGLLKMILIGLGKHEGAQYYHRLILERGFESVLRPVAEFVLASGKIAFGVALVENAYDQLAHLEVIHPQEFFRREQELLALARRLMPRLPVRSADVLVVDQIGKDISGSGMDTNVVGRKRYAPPGTDLPEITRIVVRGLTEKTLGNATGLGLADVVCFRAIANLDYRATAINCLTASHPFGARIPICCADDRTAIHVAAATCPVQNPQNLRLIRIRDTLHLEHAYVSEAIIRELSGRPDIEVGSDLRPLSFDNDGMLIPEFVPTDSGDRSR